MYTLSIIACLHRTLSGCVLLYYPRRGMTWQIGVKAWREWQVVALKKSSVLFHLPRGTGDFLDMLQFSFINGKAWILYYILSRVFRPPGTETSKVYTFAVSEGVLFKRVCLQKSQTFPDSQKMSENIRLGWWQLLQTFHHQCYLYWTFLIWYEKM